MNGNRINLVLASLMVLVFILAVAGIGGASPPQVLLDASGAPTLVSYQGQVKVAGVPYNGTGYFKFAIRTGAGVNEWTNDGTNLGNTQAPNASVSLTVTNGLFNVLLGDTSLTNMTALTADEFDGLGRYLRVWFSSDGATFTLLTPNIRFVSVPYAFQAQYAMQAENAVLAEKVTGYANVVVVAKSGGDYTTITAALNSITTASASNRYLVKVMPGVYTERVTMKPYVDIEGSGELNTKITYTGSSSSEQATLYGANNTELRWLTVENTGGSKATAIYNNTASPRLTHITVSASGGTTNNTALLNNQAASIMMTSASATSSGAGATGMHNKSSSATIRDSIITASGGTSYGVYNQAPPGGPYSIYINGSDITGSTRPLVNDAEFTTIVASSLLSGTEVIPPGSGVTCAGVYDEGYTFYASACP